MKRDHLPRRNFPGKFRFSWNQLASSQSLTVRRADKDVERGRNGDRSSVLRGTQPVSSRNRAAERNLRRSDGCSDPANDLSGHSRSFQLPLLRQHWPHQYQVTPPELIVCNRSTTPLLIIYVNLQFDIAYDQPELLPLVVTPGFESWSLRN